MSILEYMAPHKLATSHKRHLELELLELELLELSKDNFKFRRKNAL